MQIFEEKTSVATVLIPPKDIDGDAATGRLTAAIGDIKRPLRLFELRHARWSAHAQGQVGVKTL